MTQRSPRTPPHRVARDLYGDALGVETPSALGDAMEAWQELDDGEQRYVVAHLLFLQIESQASLRAATVRVRDAVDDLAEVVDRLGRAPHVVAPAEPTEPPVLDAEEASTSADQPGGATPRE